MNEILNFAELDDEMEDNELISDHKTSNKQKYSDYDDKQVEELISRNAWYEKDNTKCLETKLLLL